MRIVGLIFPEEKFVCPHCGKEYKRESDLKKHIEKEHAEKTPDTGADK